MGCIRTTAFSLTDIQIRTLRAEAGTAGDTECVALCDVALTSRNTRKQWRARERIAAIIAYAEGEAE